jgi:hypothetical protein
MLSEADLIAKRATLRWLAERHRTWTHQDLAAVLGMSRAWVSKWIHRLRQADPKDIMVLHSRSRARHTPPPAIASQVAVVQRVLEIRTAPPENLQRIPGPEAILYYLHRDPSLQNADVRLPRSQTPSLQDPAAGGLYSQAAPPQAEAARAAAPRGGGPARSERCQQCARRSAGQATACGGDGQLCGCRHFHLVASAGRGPVRCRNLAGSGRPVFARAWFACQAHF